MLSFVCFYSLKVSQNSPKELYGQFYYIKAAIFALCGPKSHSAALRPEISFFAQLGKILPHLATLLLNSTLDQGCQIIFAVYGQF